MSEIKILFVTAELTPLAKVGGLADVAEALPKSLKKSGLDVRIVLPKYGVIDEKKFALEKISENIEVPFCGEKKMINIFKTFLPHTKVPVYLIENLEFLSKNGVYFENDPSENNLNRECLRFTFFTRAVFEIFKTINFTPDVLHCQDWHVGLAPLLLKLYAAEKGLVRMRSLFTIHNLAYQGIFQAAEVFQSLAIDQNERRKFNLTGDNLNYLKHGILFADLINTVSPTYAREILTPDYGEGQENDLLKRKKDLFGILNGIDTDRFNPEKDPDIAKNYDAKNINQKGKNKTFLQKICNLNIDNNLPLFGLIGRLAEQKGINLLEPIIENLVKKPCQLVILGKGEKKYETLLTAMMKKYPQNIWVRIGFDAKLAQQIYAGADMFLMPSKYEPCGLGQMIAMRYGTIPIVRHTGGLSDTVKTFDPETGSGTGFVFENFDADELYAAIEKALKIYQNKESWQTLIKNAMIQDFSWKLPSKEYVGLYKKLLK